MTLFNKQYFNYHFIVILLIVCAFKYGNSLQAQSIFREISTSPLEDIGETFVYFPTGDTAAYGNFFKKLDKLVFEGKGNINILHIGGSHIQAGTLSNQIRTNILNMFSGLVGSRGMVFPFSVVPKNNNPLNYRTTYTGVWDFARNTQRPPKFPLGLTGMCIASMDTNASVSIRLRNNDGIIYDFNKVYVLGHCDSGYMRPMLQIQDSIIVEGVYDSAKLAYSFDLPCYADFLTLFFETKGSLWESFYLRGFWLENGLPGISYIDIGVNGATVSSYLRCSYLEKDLELVKPDFCIFSIGINDASGTDFDTILFQNNYKELIHRIRKVSPDCAILFTTNNDSFRKTGKRYYNNANGLLAQQSFHSLAKHYNAGVWDLFHFMGGLNSMKKWEEKGLAQKDKIHFTPQGYSFIGDLIYNALVSEYIKHLKNKRINGME